MSSTEKIASANLRNWEISEGRENAEKIILSERSPSVSEEDMDKYTELFSSGDNDIYSSRAVRSDRRYVAEKRARFSTESVEQKVLPGAVELLARAWLDNGEMLESDAPMHESYQAVRCSEYDDYARGADVAKTLRFSEETAEDYGTPREVTLAFDVTTSKNPEVINKKFAPFNNGVPYGFTALKYFGEKRFGGEFELKTGKNLVPRFVLGIDADNARRTLNLMSKGEDGVEEYLDKETPDSTGTRLKLLSEIYSEAEYFLDKLPEEPTSGKEETARAELELILDRASESLTHTAKKVLPIMTSPGDGYYSPTFSEPEIPLLSTAELETFKRKKLRSTSAGVDALMELFKDPESPHFDASYTEIIKRIS